MSLPPMWLKACERAEAGEVDGIVLTVNAFVSEPELLRDALLYAYEHGVAVTFAPSMTAANGDSVRGNAA